MNKFKVGDIVNGKWGGRNNFYKVCDYTEYKKYNPGGIEFYNSCTYLRYLDNNLQEIDGSGYVTNDSSLILIKNSKKSHLPSYL